MLRPILTGLTIVLALEAIVYGAIYLIATCPRLF